MHLGSDASLQAVAGKKPPVRNSHKQHVKSRQQAMTVHCFHLFSLPIEFPIIRLMYLTKMPSPSKNSVRDMNSWADAIKPDAIASISWQHYFLLLTKSLVDARRKTLEWSILRGGLSLTGSRPLKRAERTRVSQGGNLRQRLTCKMCNQMSSPNKLQWSRQET